MKVTNTETKKRLIVRPRQYEGVMSYGIDNDYPNYVIDIVAASSMGKSCVNLYRKFIFGRGFADETFAAMPLNRWGDTADRILEKVAKDYARFGGFALHLNYSAKYKITDVSHIPFAQIRFTTPDNKDHPGQFAVYKDWGARMIKKDGIRYIDKFNPDIETLQQQIEKAGGWSAYNGQILYFSNEGDGCYPLAAYDAAREDMQTDAQSKTYKYRNVTTGFMADQAVIVDPIESNENESGGNGRSAGDEKNTIVESLENFQGAENAGKIILIEKTAAGQSIEIKKIEQQDGDKKFEYTESSTRDNIRQSLLVPPVLIMQTPGKLGGAQEIIDATKYYNSVTDDERLNIEREFDTIALYFEKPMGDDHSIAPREAIRKEDIPTAILPDLTRNERRLLAGYQELTDGDTQTLAEKLQVGGTQSFLSVLSNAQLSPDEKRGALSVLFGLDDVLIDKIIKQKTENQPADAIS